MTEDSVAAIEAAPETVVIETPEGTEGQVETPPAEGQPEEKSESAKRRERDKAHRARLQQDAAQANARAAEAEAARAKLGVHVRVQLDLPNRRLFDTFEARVLLAKVFRRHRPGGPLQHRQLP